jgi:hypothetical protein
LSFGNPGFPTGIDAYSEGVSSVHAKAKFTMKEGTAIFATQTELLQSSMISRPFVPRVAKAQPWALGRERFQRFQIKLDHP